jgi:hypothetical protein
MATWDEPQRVIKPKRELKRDTIFVFICRYAFEHNGVTPSYSHIEKTFKLSRGAVRFHIYALVSEHKLFLDDRQIIVEDSEWIPPPYYEK